MSEWKEYTGIDEQIDEMTNSACGWIVRYEDGTESDTDHSVPYNIEYPTHYWIIPADPLREMKIRQAMTGQPVWVKTSDWTIDLERCDGELIPSEDKYYMTFYTTTPNWNIPNAEYSFKPFED